MQNGGQRIHFSARCFYLVVLRTPAFQKLFFLFARRNILQESQPVQTRNTMFAGKNSLRNHKKISLHKQCRLISKAMLY